VKLEGGRPRLPAVEALVSAEIPVMGHLGLTPQSLHAMGGYRVQATTPESSASLVDDAKALAAAGCFALVLEGIPAEVAEVVTAASDIPTIGIGAGPSCDGQVLVLHDLLGISERVPRFVRPYAALGDAAVDAVSAFADDVRHRRFPHQEESYGRVGHRTVDGADGDSDGDGEALPTAPPVQTARHG
jgi:3-methyl-2-oxobutanoate hydroxymethyltransferase